jgi:hypothetical protein
MLVMSTFVVEAGCDPSIIHAGSSGLVTGLITPSFFQYSMMIASALVSSLLSPVISRAGTLDPVLVRVTAASAQLPEPGVPMSIGGVVVSHVPAEPAELPAPNTPS